MSAWEIVGIVLAVLPLVIEGLDAFPESSIIKVLTAKRKRKEFIRELTNVQSGLRYAIEKLLIATDAELQPEQWAALGQSRTIKGAQFFDLWNDVLRANPWLLETNTGGDIKFVVDDMQSILSQVVEHTAVPRDAGTDVLIGLLRNHKSDPSFPMTTGLYKRFMFARSDRKRRILLDRMKNNIQWLRDLNDEHELMKPTFRGPTRSTLSTSAAEHCSFLHKIRDQCNYLYDALSEVWKCDCHKSPSAMLRLEKREAKGDDTIRFSLFLTFESDIDGRGIRKWEYREAEISIDPR